MHLFSLHCNRYDVYLFDILITWFLLTQILMINKLFIKGDKVSLERMTNHLEITNILSWKFLELSFPCQKSFKWVLESPR